VSAGLAAAGVRVILLDIEGTTTPVDFVYQTLFPFARERMHEYLRTHSGDDEVQRAIEELRTEQRADGRPVDESAAAYALRLMDLDRKSTPLKRLQGLIWESGYATGELKGEVYPDVAPALERWTRTGLGVGIFSSGSVLAQKLLFGHSSAGDLTRFLRWHFDTQVGSKLEAESYRRIAAALGGPPSGVLFVSDVGRELDAARAAGLPTRLCVRAPAELPANGGHPSIRSLEEI
jgi:enolase-phosphatase E1